MSASFHDFVRRLTAHSPVIAAAYAETRDYWLPDTPPETTTLADMAHGLVENCDQVDDPALAEIMDSVERAVAGSDRHLKTVVATGFVESLTSHAYGRKPIWSRFQKAMGPVTRRFAQSWIAPLPSM